MNLGLGYSEIAVILVIALIIIGPRRLPELMRAVGKLMGQLRRMSDDLRREILYSDEIKSFQKDMKDTLNPLAPPPVPPRLKTKAAPLKPAGGTSAETANEPAAHESEPSDQAPPEQAPAAGEPDKST